MILVTDAEEHAKRYDNYGCNNFFVKGIEMRLQAIHKCSGKTAISEEMGQLVNPREQGKSDRITRQIGEIKNYPHDANHGDKTQINFHNKNCSAF